jgi:hypothetical protein
MRNHVDHRWIKAFLRQIISVLLVYSLFLTNTANASSVGGWSMGNPIAQGASTIYEGSKNVIIDGKDYIKKGVATVAPTATNVSKVLVRGAGGLALSVAVEQLLGAVDWVLDPANNQIVYTKPAECNLNGCGTKPTHFYSVPGLDGQFFTSPESACYSYNIYDKDAWYGPVYAEGNHCRSSELSPVVTLSIYNNPTYDSAAEEQEQKTLPLDAVSAQVISNAESDTDKKVGAQVATTAAAADIVAEAETDSVKARPIAQQLESSASTKPTDQAAADQANTATGTQTQNPTKPETSDLALEFPAFCGWAPTVCEAAQVVISFPQTLTDWWEAAKEWAKNDENQDTDNEPPEIKEIDIDALDTSTFKGVAGCPAPITVPITFGDGGETEISYEPICQLAEKWSFVAPLIGFLSGAMIIVGVGRKGEDGEI